jgi:ubiquinone/menaquinone biosynthesis C-methylase UbiE
MKVLDIGCGAGFDLFVASRLVGPEGLVVGVDLTEEMAAKAAANLARTGVANTAVQQIDSERLPFGDNTFDAVLSNGVINLSPDKKTLYAEVLRVLKPNGRLGYADIVLEKELPPDLAGSAESWAQ